MGRRKAKRKARRGDKQRAHITVLDARLVGIEHRLASIEGHLREVAVTTGAKKRAIVLRPHLQDDAEHDLTRIFLDGQPHRTPELGDVMQKDRRQVLRILRRINRRVKHHEGVEPFHFDPATRTWQLQLEIVDRKELQ